MSGAALVHDLSSSRRLNRWIPFVNAKQLGAKQTGDRHYAGCGGKIMRQRNKTVKIAELPRLIVALCGSYRNLKGELEFMIDRARCSVLRLAAVMVFFGTGCLCTVAQAAAVSAGPSTVKSQSMYSYASFGGGDVVFELTTNPVSQCYGFWLRATDPGFKNNLAVLLSVVTTGVPITVNADDSTANHWTGSGTAYCIVTNLLL